MASTTTAQAASTTTSNTVVLTPAIQRQVNALRSGREMAKQGKAQGEEARQAILTALGTITENLVGTDAKGKRLINVKVIPSSESFDWDKLALQQPELFELLKKEYTLPRGSGEATIRVDIL